MIGPDNAKLVGFKNLLLTTCGLCFENEREATLIRALCQRMTSRRIEDFDDYHVLLANDTDEFNRLVELLTVNETYFFREPDHLKLLVERLIPDMVEERKGGRLRIVSAGCSTGEEPYSIAMLLHERYGTDFGRLFAITGVDIDGSAIDRAKHGVYGKNSFRAVDDNRLGLYFEPFGRNEYRLKEEIRQNVTLEVINLLGAVYPASMQTPDVILYRNVSIYFPGQVQQAIFSRLACLLAEGGYLLVGATETIHHNVGILSLVEKDELFFYRKLPNFFIEDRRNRSGADGERGLPAAGAGRPATPTARGQQRAARHGHASPARAPRQQSSPDAHALFDEALGLAQDNRPDAALELLDTLIRRDDSFVKAYLLKGTILLNSSRFDEARENCDKALANNPLCLEASLMLGIIARHDENDDEALRRFREAIYLDSACWPGHFYTAEISYARGDMKRACSAYESALRILEGDPSGDRAQTFFPLVFKTDQFTAICRHKLALIRVQGK
ncbi:MAG: CheR family methyltransferase [Oryzomonas sp.]|uniref:CheR family methyltransferase n=1 Tax=Oryzomonas sp. TaxID=2855186 RepID=UPI00284A63E4|nr:CheR family methyltransferase [Oryzomonas sp.]MDR3580178.1 CheR family methyltransferase [Oryzomonas sp.]